MLRVACCATAISIVVTTSSVGVAAEGAKDAPKLDVRVPDARVQAWFWSFPQGRPERQTRDRKRSDRKKKKKRVSKRFLLFSGSDLWREGNFLYGGMLWAPSGLDRDSLVVKLITTRGYYRYRSGTLGNASVVGALYATSVMPGVRFTRGGVTAFVFAGLDYQVHVLSRDDPGNDIRGRHSGVRIAADLWYQPTPVTMLAVSATLTSIDQAYAMRTAYGWRVLDRFWLGPEAVVYGASNYQQLRIGAHFTGLDFLWLQWQAAVGYAVDDDGNRGVYVRLGTSDRW